MKKLTICLIYLTFFSACAQPKNTTQRTVGGRCECCEAIYQGMPKNISWQTTIADDKEEGERMEISGVIYKKDGVTPAPNVILYVYHTDAQGNYSRGTGDACTKRHGKLRGWVQTNEKGQYKLITIKPASYPNSTIPSHIHPTIKEPDTNEYYIDEYLFEGDKFLTQEERSHQENRGGKGIIELKKDSKGVWIGQRDIILGKNIPNY